MEFTGHYVSTVIDITMMEMFWCSLGFHTCRSMSTDSLMNVTRLVLACPFFSVHGKNTSDSLAQQIFYRYELHSVSEVATGITRGTKASFDLCT